MSRLAFDAIVIGAGQAGPPLAVRLAGAGMRVALIERHLVGGTCVNTGCMPTKTLVASARAAHLAGRADLGIVADNLRVDFARVKARADAVSAKARSDLTAWIEGTERLTLIRGHARLEGPNLVRVGETGLAAPRIFLNVGGRARLPDFPGAADVPALNNTSMLALDRCPEHLIVVGGSYVGLEFAQIYRRLGAEVTVVERNARLVMREDEEVSEAIRAILEGEGIKVRTSADCIRLEPGARGRPRLRRRAARGARKPCPAGGRPPAQYRRSRPRNGRGRHRQARLHPGRRRARHQRARHLGARRMQRPRRLHPHRL